MENLSLAAELRNTQEKTKDLRRNSIIPAVVYGHSQEAMSIQLDYSIFLKLFRISWESHIISLKVGKKSIDVLVHDIQKEPVSGDFTHIDFYAITKWEKLTTKIHLNFINNSEAAKSEWALIEEHIKELEVKCLPTDLVDSFDVDLSKLEKTWDHIRVVDLGIDTKKYEITVDENDIVVNASKPAKVEIEEPVEAAPVEWEASESDSTEEEK